MKKFRNSYQFIFSILIGLAFLTSCGGDEDSVTPENPANTIEGEQVRLLFDGNATDAKGNVSSISVSGAVLTTDRKGNTNSAYSFDGTDDYISIPSSNILVADSAFSISIWAKPSEMYGFFFNKEFDYQLGILERNVFFPGIGNVQSPHITWAIGNTSPGWFSQYPTTISYGVVWKHYVLTYQNGTTKTYVDGELKNTSVGSGKVSNNDFNLIIGGKRYAQTSSGVSFFFKGSLDDFRYYNTTLSSV